MFLKNQLNSRSCPIPALFHCFSGYHVPEKSKHRKCTIDNLSCTALQSCADALFGCLQGAYWSKENWKEFKSSIEKLAKSISDYANYLLKQSVVTKRLHLFTEPVRQIADNLSFQILPQSSAGNHGFQELESKLMNRELYEYVVLETVCPQDPRKKYEFIQNLKCYSLTARCTLLTYAHGNYIGNTHFVWKVCDAEDAFSLSQQTIEMAKKEIPVFHTRAMRYSLLQKFGRVCSTIKPVVLRALYREISNDSSAPNTLSEAEIDERMERVLEMENPDLVVDLRQLSTGKKSKYDAFWDECQKFLQEGIGAAVDDRRHQVVTHMAAAVSASDLLEQVKKPCPDETHIPFFVNLI